jgi:hypothetical protein
MADVLPIAAPSRAELWRRVQLARSVLAQRPSTPDTGALALRILDGVPLDTLVGEMVYGA